MIPSEIRKSMTWSIANNLWCWKVKGWVPARHRVNGGQTKLCLCFMRDQFHLWIRKEGREHFMLVCAPCRGGVQLFEDRLEHLKVEQSFCFPLSFNATCGTVVIVRSSRTRPVDFSVYHFCGLPEPSCCNTQHNPRCSLRLYILLH